ncbi:hypothetical protein HYFRA_00003473 [Hymenoscyphus fraxineus]|uniref:2EXR domain-containing protein n=1 Tax=Hymenoscyphus fraxineus TaxID=746836 RepID=A0A9N9PHM8_9HELO|nr:hypothetical protein HYFRA_00003473 [Hymenoscyphus fraxineus]
MDNKEQIANSPKGGERSADEIGDKIANDTLDPVNHGWSILTASDIIEPLKAPRFHFFARLDHKIRHKIWLLAHEASSRNLVVRLQNSPDGVIYRHLFPNREPWEIYTSQIPTLLSVCKEARDILLPKYSTPFDNDNVRVCSFKGSVPGGNFPFCWETDLLLVNLEEYWSPGSLHRVFTEIFGHYYTNAGNSLLSSSSVVKQRLRRVGGNFVMWNSVLGGQNLSLSNAAFFDDFENLKEVVFAPFWQRLLQMKFQNPAQYGGFERESLRGPWGQDFQRRFRRGMLKWLPDQLEILNQNRRDERRSHLGMYDSTDYYFYDKIPPYLPPTVSNDRKSQYFKSFTLFPELPAELRAEIWRLSFPQGRYIDIRPTTVLDDYGYLASLTGSWHAVASECVPVAFFVNQEARFELLRYYQPIKSNDNYPTIFANLKLDVLCFYHPCRDTLPDFLNTVSVRTREAITEIQGLRMTKPGRVYNIDFAHRLPNLRVIRIDHDQDSSLPSLAFDRNQPRTIGWEEEASRELLEDEERQLEEWGFDPSGKHPLIRFGRRLESDRRSIN